MSKTLTIAISDEEYEALQAAGTQTLQSPEELAAATIAAQFGGNARTRSMGPTPDTYIPQPPISSDPINEVAQAHGHLVDPATRPPYPGAADIPAYGSPARTQFEATLTDELSEGLERSGGNILDLIERR